MHFKKSILLPILYRVIFLSSKSQLKSTLGGKKPFHFSLSSYLSLLRIVFNKFLVVIDRFWHENCQGELAADLVWWHLDDQLHKLYEGKQIYIFGLIL